MARREIHAQVARLTGRELFDAVHAPVRPCPLRLAIGGQLVGGEVGLDDDEVVRDGAGVARDERDGICKMGELSAAAVGSDPTLRTGDAGTVERGFRS